MELLKGPCIICSNKHFVAPVTISKLFMSLFSEDVINIQLLKQKLPLLKFCHICYQKLNFLKQIHEKFIDTEWSVSEHHCLVCKTEDANSLIEIVDRQYFSKISTDFGFPEEKKYHLCLGCLFYLDTRSALKEKLLLKFPQLKIKQIHSPSSSQKSRRGRKDAPVEAIAISSGDEDDSKSINLSVLGRFKPLKKDRSLINLDVVANDPRLLSQVPYTLLQVSNFSEKRWEISPSNVKVNSKTQFFKIRLRAKRPGTPVKKSLKNNKTNNKRVEPVNKSDDSLVEPINKKDDSLVEPVNNKDDSLVELVNKKDEPVVEPVNNKDDSLVIKISRMKLPSITEDKDDEKSSINKIDKDSSKMNGESSDEAKSVDEDTIERENKVSDTISDQAAEDCEAGKEKTATKASDERDNSDVEKMEVPEESSIEDRHDKNEEKLEVGDSNIKNKKTEEICAQR